jgi:thiosulfate dehydrogenase (quinone) large subunit
MSYTNVSVPTGSGNRGAGSRGGREISTESSSEVRVDQALGYFVLRVGLGLAVMLHGLVRLSIYGQFIDATVKQFAGTFLPVASVKLLAYTLPFAESAIGFFVLIGLGTRYASFLGGLFMVPLLLGMNILQQWAIVEIQLIYVLFYFLLLVFREWNEYSVDGLMRRNKRRVRESSS